MSHHLESTHHIAIVTDLQCMSICWIYRFEHIPEFLVSFCYSDILELCSILPVWRSIWISHLVENPIDIEPSTATEDWDISFILYPFDDRECLCHKINNREHLTRIYHIDHMVGDSSHLVGFYFASSDIHMTIDLP